MAVPAPAIPTGNAYTVNVARPAGDLSPLPAFTCAAAHLLRRWKIPVRMHLAGDGASTNAMRARLNEAGARPSAFSPAPSPAVPGEGFWKTTMIVVENPDDDSPGARFWADDRDDKKVGWDPLMIALTDDTAFARLTAAHVAQPDLWIISSPTAHATHDDGGTRDVARRWVDAGAGAVCVVGRDEVHWHTGSAAFGRSAGARARLAPPLSSDEREASSSGVNQSGEASGISNGPQAVTPASLGAFAAGVVTGLMRDLLSENLFDKTLLRADRECLEMRPLRLGVAIVDGLAALAAAAENPPGRGFTERAEAFSVSLKGPASRPWAHKGR